MKRYINLMLEHKLIDSAILIGFITILSYLLTYIYEATYMEYFGLGAETARVELVPVITTVFVVFALTIMAGLPLFMIVRGIKRANHSYEGLFLRALIIVYVIILGMVPLFYAENPEHYKTYILWRLFEFFKFWVLALIITTPLFLLVGLISKNGKGSKSGAGRIGKIVTYEFMAFSIVVTMLITYTQAFAVTTAFHKSDFKLIEQNGKSSLVVREYANYFVAVGYNPQTNTITGEYSYINFADRETLSYTMLHKKPNYSSEFLKEAQRPLLKKGIFEI